MRSVGIASAALAAVLGVVGGRQLTPTIYTEAHRRRTRHLGPGVRRAGFNTPEDAARAARRASRWLRSPRTSGTPPTHIAEKLQILAAVAKD